MSKRNQMESRENKKHKTQKNTKCICCCRFLLAGYFLYLSYCLFYSILLVKFPVFKMISQYLWWPQIVTMKQNARTCFFFSFFCSKTRSKKCPTAKQLCPLVVGRSFGRRFYRFIILLWLHFCAQQRPQCPVVQDNVLEGRRSWKNGKNGEWREWIKLAGNIQTHS